MLDEEASGFLAVHLSRGVPGAVTYGGGASDESASVCLGGAGRQCIEAVLPLVRKPRLAPDQLTRVDTGFMSTFPQLSTSKKMHGFMRSRESVAQNDWSGDALQEALLNPLIFTRQHESRAPDTRIGCGQTNA